MKKLSNYKKTIPKKEIGKKSVVLLIATLFILGAFIPAVNSQVGHIVENQPFEESEKSEIYPEESVADEINIMESTDSKIDISKTGGGSLLNIFLTYLIDRLADILGNRPIIYRLRELFTEMDVNSDEDADNEIDASDKINKYDISSDESRDHLDPSPFGAASDLWWDTNWQYRKEITINHTEVDADLTDFSVLISLVSDEDLANGSKCQNDGDDIVFTNVSGTKLHHEIEYFDNDTGELAAWVNTTSLSGTVDTVIYMYYGNSSCGSQENISGTWDSNYLVVYHMDDLTSSSIKDSIGTQNGTKRTSNGPQQVNGVIGYGQEFNNSNIDRIDITGLTDSTQAYTFSMWAYNTGVDNTYLFDTQSGRIMVYARYTDGNLGLYDGSWRIFGGVSSNSWHYITYTVSSGASNAYVNGTQSGSQLGWVARDIGGIVNIGSRYAALTGNWFSHDGMIDEFRISKIVRSSGWTKTEYNNMVNASDGGFYNIGLEENIDDEPIPSVSFPNPLDESTSVGLALSSCYDHFNITVSDPEGDTMNITWRTNESGTWETMGTNISIINGTYYCTNVSWVDTNFTMYWWSVNVSDGNGGWMNETFWFVTIGNAVPSVSFPNPLDESTSVELALSSCYDHFNITVSDPEGDTMNITWRTNESGTWETMGTNISIINGTYYCTNVSWVDTNFTKYWWSVNVSDGNGRWRNETFWFVTIGYYDFAIIAYEDWYEYDGEWDLQRLADWHNTNDTLKTYIVNLSNITNNPEYWVDGTWGDGNSDNPYSRLDETSITNYNMFNDTQAKIRNYIRYANHELGVTYVLLVGTSGNIPTRNLFGYALGGTGGGFNANIPAEMYYGCLNGTFNDDEDSYAAGVSGWGENETLNGNGIDEVDWGWDVAIGRFPSRSVTELSNNVRKTISYMGQSETEDYLDNVTLSGYECGWGSIGDGIGYSIQLKGEICDNGVITTYGFDNDTYTFTILSEDTGFPDSILMNAANARNTFNEGVHIWYHTGNGQLGRWSGTSSFTITDVEALTNTKYGFVLSTIPADTGSFDIGYCLAEAFVNSENGAFATIQNARTGFDNDFTEYNSFNSYYAREVFDAYFDESVTRLGDMHTDAISDCLWILAPEEDGSRHTARWALFQKNLLGSPAVMMQLGNTAPSVSFPNPLDESTSVELALSSCYDHFNITVSDPEGDTMNITWRTNESGTWETMGTNISIINGTYYCTNVSWVDTNFTKYWWSVNVSDGNGRWRNETFWFVTIGYYDFAIIAYEDWYEYDGEWDLQRLADWHNTNDTLKTYIVNLSNITNNPEYWVDGTWGDGNSDNPYSRLDETSITNYNMFNDTQAKIRNYIRYANHELGVTYVLLVGTSGNIPTRNLFGYALGGTGGGFNANIPAEMYYGCLNGTFNDDEDSYAAGVSGWGENETLNGNGIDEVDWGWDVAIGRFPSRSVTELSNNVRKTISYMGQSETEDYLDNVTLSGYECGWGSIGDGIGYSIQLKGETCDNGVITTYGFDNDTYTFTILSEDTGFPDSILMNAANARNTFNEGVHIWYHTGNGQLGRWSGTSSFTITDVEALTNTKYGFVLSTIPADTGSFDIGYCLAEAFVNSENGAFATIQNARTGFDNDFTEYNSFNSYYAREVFDAYFDESVTRLGDMHTDAISDCLWILAPEEDGSRHTARWALFQKNLLGSPAVMMQLGNTAPSVSFPNPLDESTSVELALSSCYDHFNITVSDPEGDTMNITWRTNESGTWETMGTNISIINGTYYCTNVSWVDTNFTKYWWSVNVSDGNGRWRNETFWFVTIGYYDFAIIAYEDWYEYDGEWDLQRLADWHNTNDTLKTYIVNLSNITNNPEYWVDGTWGDGNSDNPYSRLDETSITNYNMFNDTQAKIRNYIRYANHELGVTYVLLVGTSGNIPTRNLFGYALGGTGGGFNANIPAEMYYGCLNGTFNDDEDSYAAGVSGWGENETLNGNGIDEVDWGWDVAIGRFPSRSVTELSNNVRKTISYMGQSETEDYLDNVTLSGYECGWGSIGDGIGYSIQLKGETCDNGVITTYGFDNDTYTFTILSEDTGFPDSILMNAANARNTFNEGVHIWYHNSHGQLGRWSGTSSFTITDVEALTNTKYGFVLSPLACSPGSFDIGYCLAEAFVNSENGAFATIQNARTGFDNDFTEYNSFNSYYAREVFDAYFDESVTRLGDMHTDAISDCSWILAPEEDGSRHTARWTLFQKNLLGSPAVMMQLPINGGDTTLPEINNVQDSPDPQEVGGYVNISCNVTDNDAVDEVRVNITYPDDSTTNVTMLEGSYYYNTTYSQIGTHSYFIWTNDTSGNENTSLAYSFTIKEDAMTEGASGTYLVNETDTTQYSFLTGTFDSTKFDDNIDAVVLNNSYSSNFTSEVFDGGSTVSWNNISWLSNGIGELPNNRQIEDKPDGVDMTDNEVLFHFNNQSEHNENDTYLHDFSGSGHYGNNSALLVSNGKLEGGVEFDGTSDHRIFIKDGMSDFWDDAGNWSVAMWIYARDTSGNIIGKRDDGTPWIWIDGSYSIGFSIYYGTVSGFHPSYDVDPDQWTHLVMTRNQSEIRIYKNGVLHADLDSSTSQNGNVGGGDLQIGAYGSSSSRLNGLIDELAFFSRSLSAVEIENVYKRGLIQLNVSVSSCDDPSCIGESWVDIDDMSPQSLGVADNQYFQYNFAFETEDLSYSPELYNVTIRYSEPDTIPPEITNVADYPDPQDAGWYVNISGDVDDNLGVDEVWVNITYPDSSYHNETILGGSYYYNATYAMEGTYYYFIWANDTSGNSNTSLVYDFVIQQDITPPASITNLQNLTGGTWISWMWTNPTSFDFNHTMVYLNGIWMMNTSNPFYSATMLDSDAYYEIGTRTVDQAGNINMTWVNQTSKTLDLQVHNIDTGLNYSTIQEAIDAAETMDGHMILVDPGSYTENVDVYKSLTIRSTSGDSSDTVVQAEDSNMHVFEVSVDYVNISGFTVKDANVSGIAGISLTYVDHCNLSNNNATNNYHGIYLYSSSNNTIEGNVVSSNDENGIYLYMSSDNNTIVNNQGNSSGHNGIYLYMSSDNNTIANNIFNSNGVNNIYARESNNNTIANNTVNDSEWGICLYISCNNTTIVNNTAIDNSPWGIWVGVSCNNNTITDNTATNNDYGISIRDTTDSEIADNNATNNNYGIWLYESSFNNTIVNNNASSNNNYGIAVRESSNNTIANNNASSNTIDGIFIYDSSSNNTVKDNNVTDNDHGIAMRGSSNNTIADNTASSNNNYGIYLYISSISNTIINNTAKNNDYGIYLQSSSNNIIYNNYFNNTDNALDDGDNIWNISKTSGTNIIGGVYLGGNYWSDYNGIDTDGDGLGDTDLPYNSNGDIQNGGDWLPLVFSISDTTPPEISNVDIELSDPIDTETGFGWENITCTVTGNVEVDEVRLNITYPDLHTESHLMTDDGGGQYYYNTTYVDVGTYSYHIWANDTSDNSNVSSVDTFEIPPNYDIRLLVDRMIDISDLNPVSLIFGSSVTAGSIREDVNNDGLIDISDLNQVTLHFGEGW